MILSDRSLREAIANGQIVVEPFDPDLVQPSSIDVRLDRFFRVFRNHTSGVIDVKQDTRGLTELVEIDDDDVFMLHPGEFVLGSTLERVAVPDHLVGRVEGKSSLGRLGLLIHSSLPASEAVLVLDESGLVMRTIGAIVKEPRPCSIVGFDPATLEVSYHEVTNWYEGPADRIFEVRLASGRSVRVTAAHTLFTLDAHGEIVRVRTAELEPGTLVAIPRRIPEPPLAAAVIDVVAAVPEAELQHMMLDGPAVAAAHAEHPTLIAALLHEAGYEAVSYYRSRHRLPYPVAAQVPGLLDALGTDDRIARRGERHRLPLQISVDEDLAWLLGMFIAEGHRRRNQVNISNTDQTRLDRLEATLAGLGLPVYRSAVAVTCCSGLLSDVLGWIGTGDGAPQKRVPPAAFGWPDHILRSFLDGMVDGDGSVDEVRTSVWTTSEGLVADLLVLFARLGLRASCSAKPTGHLTLWQVLAPHREHKQLATTPLPERLLLRARAAAGLSQAAAARAAGYRNPTDLNNIERRRGRDAVRFETLRRLADAYARHGADADSVGRLHALANGDLAWDRVESVTVTDRVEPIYDLEVRPGGRAIENFLAGSGGVFVSNTAGFIDAGFDGHVTLELANVASLPITLYPGMKIGQISFMEMTTPADRPYGKGATGSKYQGQRGPTPSRYFENFAEPAPDDTGDPADE